MKPKMIIDTDTASDDVVALMMVLMNLRVEVVAITVVAGNVSTQHDLEHTILQTPFRFDSVGQTRELLLFCVREKVDENIKSVEIGFNLAAYPGELG